MQVLLALFAMARPLQLVAVSLVYVMGMAIAAAMEYEIAFQAMIFGYVALIPVSASIHYANEYADYETDALTERTPFSGGSGALPRSGLSPVVALRGALISLLLGTALALVGASLGMLSVAALAVLMLGAFFGWMYSLPPLALAWHGWGELDNAMLGGVLLPLYGFAVVAAKIDARVIAICLPFGALVFINLLATTWPDREADAAVGKNTLATRWSVVALRRLYALGAFVAFAGLLFLWGWGQPNIVVGAAFFVLPVVIWGFLRYTRQVSPFPTVFAMTLMMLLYIVTWALVAYQNSPA